MKYIKNIEALQKLQKPKAVIFDWDNTLVDTWPLIHAAINNVMRAMDKEEWTLKKVKDNIHKAMRDSFPEIFGDDWQKAGEIYVNSYRMSHLDNLQLLPNSLELINKLYEKNILQFIVSNKIGSTLRKEVKKLNLEDKFFSSIGSQDADFDKPDRAPVDLALMGSGIDCEKDHIWFVGDTVADINCAYNCKFQPIIYGNDNEISKTIPQDLYEKGREGEGAIALYFNHQELIDIIDKL